LGKKKEKDMSYPPLRILEREAGKKEGEIAVLPLRRGPKEREKKTKKKKRNASGLLPISAKGEDKRSVDRRLEKERKYEKKKGAHHHAERGKTTLLLLSQQGRRRGISGKKMTVATSPPSSPMRAKKQKRKRQTLSSLHDRMEKKMKNEKDGAGPTCWRGK